MSKPNRFKLTPDIHKMIKDLVKKIGPFHRRDKNGELMYRKITKFIGKRKDEKTKRMINDFEIISQPILIPHEVNLVDIYQKDGQAGIDMYVEFFDKLKKEEEAAKPGLHIVK